MRTSSRWSVFALGALLAGSGFLHFVVPAPYRHIVPAPLRPYSVGIVALSGVCEFACAGLLATPATRRLGAGLTAALFVAVFPANVQMALDSGYDGASFPLNSSLLSWLRLPLQIPLILWALSIRRSSP